MKKASLKKSEDAKATEAAAAESATPESVEEDDTSEKAEAVDDVKEEKVEPAVSDKPPMERCRGDPNFAVVCSFLDQFGAALGVPCPSIEDLEQMLEREGEPGLDLITFQVKLLRKLKKTVSFDKWERVLTKFAFTQSSEDGWELDRFGYKRAKLGLRIRLVKHLCEAQFDLNAR